MLAKWLSTVMDDHGVCANDQGLCFQTQMYAWSCRDRKCYAGTGQHKLTFKSTILFYKLVALVLTSSWCNLMYMVPTVTDLDFLWCPKILYICSFPSWILLHTLYPLDSLFFSFMKLLCLTSEMYRTLTYESSYSDWLQLSRCCW